MNRRHRCWVGLIGAITLGAGCDYAPSKRPSRSTESYVGPLPNQAAKYARSAVVEDPNSDLPQVEGPESIRRREVILANVLKLMQDCLQKSGRAELRARHREPERAVRARDQAGRLRLDSR